MKRIQLFMFAGLLLAACAKDDSPQDSSDINGSPLAKTYDGQFLQDYFTLQCDVARNTDGFFPPIAARAYGYTGIAAYESVMHGIPGAQSLAGQVQGIPAGSLPTPQENATYNWALVANASVAKMMHYMFGQNLDNDDAGSINTMEADHKSLLSVGTSADVVNRSETYGRELADAIYTLSLSDGGHEAYLNPFQTPFEWEPLDFCWIPTGGDLYPLSPKWKDNRTFISGIGVLTEAPPHVPFSSDTQSEFYAQAMEMYTQVINQSGQEVTIAQYWADDPFQTCTPTGHTFNIVKQLLSETGATLEKTAVTFGMIGVAENESFICCWKTKYEYMLIRPVSYIRQYIDPNFETAIGTPPFPSYTSGHATEIAAAAKIMTRLFGNADGDYTFTDLSQIQYGFSARSFDNFYDLAQEDANSRWYGGVHYEMDNTSGLAMGYQVGDAVLAEINWPQNIE